MNVSEKKLIVAITGASGAIYGVRLLQVLHAMPDIETHLLVSAPGELNLQHELGMSSQEVAAFADVVHDVRDIGAAIASGSCGAAGMIIAPCSMKTLAGIAQGFADNLIGRAADVMLKERRRLVLMVRETPFNLIHLRNMLSVTEAGGIIFPPLPAFYQQPSSIDEMVADTVNHALDLLGLSGERAKRWSGATGPAIG